MLYVFHGTNTDMILRKARALVDALRAKRPDSSYVRIDAEHWEDSVVEEHAGGQGLFSKAYIIFLDHVTENDLASKSLADLVPLMHESPNVFIVREGQLTAALKKSFDVGADKVVEIDLPKLANSGSQNEFNIFALADAIGQRDQFGAWSVYRQAVDAGHESEGIIGTIFWQLKSMMLAAASKNASEAGLNPFVFTKASKAAGRYSNDEVRMLTRRFVEIYHDGHRGLCDIALNIEMTLLKL